MSWATIVLGLSLLVNTHCLAQPATNQVVYLAPENVSRVGKLEAESSRAVGTCFYCDERGYVATCLSNLLDCKDAYVQFDTKTRLRVAGFVAASRGMDIVILQMLEIPKGDERFRRALELRPDYTPEIDHRLLPWSALNPHLITTENVPKLWYLLRGDEFSSGMKSLNAAPLGCRPDTCWMWLNQPSNLGYNGAPLFSEGGHVVGMMSLGPSRQREIYSALHIQHVMDLIPRDEPKPKPIKTLKTWVDPVPTVAAEKRGPTLVDKMEDRLAGDLEYGLPLAARYMALLKRQAQAITEKANIEQSMATRQERNLELLAKIDEQQTQVRKMVPEEAYTVKERDKDDKRDREVTRYRFSKRQLEQIDPLQTATTTLQRQSDEIMVRFQYETQIRLPFVKEVIEHLEEETFYLADPLGLRPSAEHSAFEKALTEVIEEGGAQACVYLARGMTRIHLRKFKEATADLQEAYDVDTKFRPMCRALNARIAGLQGAPEKADSTIKGLMRDHKDNPRVLTLVARIDMDSKTSGSAAKNVQQAQELLPHQLELQLAVAWLLSQNNTNAKLAMESATSAVTRTGYSDWNALAALANVHMMVHKQDTAVEVIRAAARIAPPSAHSWCADWQQQIESENLIKREWK